MKNALIEMLSSKKFLATLVAVIVWLTGRLGLDLDADLLLPIVGAIATYVVAQGAADFMKSSAVITSESTADAVAGLKEIAADPEDPS